MKYYFFSPSQLTHQNMFDENVQVQAISHISLDLIFHQSTVSFLDCKGYHLDISISYYFHIIILIMCCSHCILDKAISKQAAILVSHSRKVKVTFETGCHSSFSFPPIFDFLAPMV